MKRAVTRIAVATVGMLALAAPAAHAGGGAGSQPTPIEGFLCYTVQKGLSQNITATIANPIGAPTQVVIKSGRLLCVPTTVTVPGSEVTNEITTGDHLGCYTLNVPGPDKVPQPALVGTPIDTEVTRVLVPKFVCFFSDMTTSAGTPDGTTNLE